MRIALFKQDIGFIRRRVAGGGMATTGVLSVLRYELRGINPKFNSGTYNWRSIYNIYVRIARVYANPSNAGICA